MSKAIGFAAALSLTLALITPAEASAATLRVEKSDLEMQAAEKQARGTLPIFWRHLANRDPKIDLALVKVGYPTPGGGTEFLWMVLTGIEGSKVSGQIVNEPLEVPGVHVRQKVVVDKSTIGDWAYRKGGKFYGHFTTRVMLKRVDAKTAAAESVDLAPTPLERGDH